jgi:hypothetical protein
MELTLEKAQSVEVGTRLRIKFAAITPRGDLVGDALEEYGSFFDELPPGWSAARLPEPIETRTEFFRPAWHLQGGEQDILAVEHETGVEILLIGVLTEVVAASIIALAIWGWKRWGTLRRGSDYPKVDSSLVIEIPRDSVNGPLPPLRLVIPPPVSDKDVSRYLKLAASIVPA